MCAVAPFLLSGLLLFPTICCAFVQTGTIRDARFPIFHRIPLYIVRRLLHQRRRLARVHNNTMERKNAAFAAFMDEAIDYRFRSTRAPPAKLRLLLIIIPASLARHLLFAARAALCVYHARCHWFVHFYVAPAMCGQIRTCDKTNASVTAINAKGSAELENCRSPGNKEISYIWICRRPI